MPESARCSQARQRDERAGCQKATVRSRETAWRRTDERKAANARRAQLRLMCAQCSDDVVRVHSGSLRQQSDRVWALISFRRFISQIAAHRALIKPRATFAESAKGGAS